MLHRHFLFSVIQNNSILGQQQYYSILGKHNLRVSELEFDNVAFATVLVPVGEMITMKLWYLFTNYIERILI